MPQAKRKSVRPATTSTTAATAAPDGFMSRAEAAALCRLNIQSIDQGIKLAQLRRFKVGRRVLLKRADVIAWIESKEA